MNATMAAVLADAGPPPPTGGNFLPLVHYGGWALYVACLLGLTVLAAMMVWRVDVPAKRAGLVFLEPCSVARPAPSSGRCSE